MFYKATIGDLFWEKEEMDANVVFISVLFACRPFRPIL